jgi:hypothetical protein
MPEVREHPLSMPKNIDGGPLAGDDRGPGTPTINTKKCRRWVPWDVLTEIQERPPSMLKKHRWWAPWEAVPENLGAHTINAKKRRWWPSWEAVSEIRKHPPSTLRNIDGGALGRCQSWRYESVHHQR